MSGPGPLWAQDGKADADQVLLTEDKPELDSEGWDARVTEVHGDVSIIIAGDDPEGVAAQKDMPLQSGDRIKTGPGSSAEISFEGNSVISLRPNSDFTLKSANRKETEFVLALGS